MARTTVYILVGCILLLSVIRAQTASAAVDSAPPLVIACMTGNEPLSFVAKTGEPAGLLVDFWRLWGRKVGRAVTFRMASWDATVADLRAGRAQIHFGMYITGDRAVWAHFGPPLYPARTGILSAAGGREAVDPAQLGEGGIAVLNGSVQESFLRERYPDLRLLPANNITAMLMAVVRGQAQGVAGMLPTLYSAIDALGLTPHFAQRPIILFTRSLHPAVRKEDAALLPLLEEGFARISRDELVGLENRWIRNRDLRVWGKMRRELRLNDVERAWLAAHPLWRVALHGQWPPLEFASGEQMRGLSLDVVRLLTVGLGVEAVPVPLGRGVVAAPVDADVVPFMDDVPAGTRPWLFTRSVLSLPVAAIMRDSDRLVTGFDDLAGKTLAVHNHLGLEARLRELVPDVKTVPLAGVNAGLDGLRRGDYDAVVDLALAADYTLRNGDIKGLRPVPLPGLQYAVRLAVRGDWPQLVGILDKALDSVPHDDLVDLVEHWANLQVERTTDWTFVWRLTALGLLCGGSLLGVTLLWNRRLARESQARRQALDAAEANAEALEQREQQLRAIVDHLPSMVILKDEAGRYLLINKRVEEFFGRSAAELEGKTNSALLSAAKAAEAARVDREVLASGGIRRYQEVMHNKDGEARDVEVVKVPLRDEKGRLFGLIFTGTDVTERRRAEREMRRAEAEMAQIFNASGGGMRVIDRDLRVQEVNAAYLRLFDHSRDAVPGAPGGGPLDEDGGVTVALVRRVLQGEARSTGTALRHARTGRAVYCDLVMTPLIAPDGVLRGVIEDCRDVTDLVQSRQAMEQAKQAAEQANRAKSEFLANMSHEIRTPMNAIMGLTHLLQQTDVTPRQHEYLRHIAASARALLRIINDILDFSKIEAGRMEMEQTEFALEEVLDQLMGLESAKSADKGLELLLHLSPDVPRRLVGDPLRLGQVLINLVDNAVKFTEKGEVAVAVQRESQGDGHAVLRFSVRDTGMGMTEDQAAMLFQPFAQADTSTTRRFGGTGLGLSICRRIVSLMGGELRVESEVGEGSTFWFTAHFGLAADQARPATVACRDQAGLQGLRVLVVDDAATGREILCQALETVGFCSGQAASGGEALDELVRAARAGEPYQLVLMDWKMPSPDGIETAELIRACPDLPHTPTVFMVSAYGREEIMRRAQAAGIRHFLIKPVSPMLLLQTIGEVFGSSVAASARPLAAAPPRAMAEGDSLRVLLAEDNEINQLVAKELLEAAGLTVDIANNGREAVDMALEGDYAAVFMDIHMPEMDGITATQLLRGTERCRSLPIIALTADGMLGDHEKSLAAGMDDHLPKPIDPESLMAAVRRWVRPAASSMSDTA